MAKKHLVPEKWEVYISMLFIVIHYCKSVDNKFIENQFKKKPIRFDYV